MVIMNVAFSLLFDLFGSLFLAMIEFYCYRNFFSLSRDRILDLETNEWFCYITNMSSKFLVALYIMMNLLDFISYLESQANIHVIDIISLNQESYDQSYEMAGMIKNDSETEIIQHEPSAKNKEVLLEEKNGDDNKKI